MSLSERRTAILMDEGAWQEAKRRVERFLASPKAAWLAGGALLVNMFAVGMVESL